MSDPKILVTRNGPVIEVVNNNPQSKNSLSPEFIIGFSQLLAAIEDGSEDGRVILLSGAEGFFCSGGNLDGLKQRSESDYAQRRGNVDRINQLILSMRSCKLPIIAVLEGGAAGAGVGLALACDMIIASDQAYVMAAYVKIGITPDGGMTPFMTEAIPRWLLSELVFTGDKMPVKRLYEMGVVNELTESGKTKARALEIANRLAAGPAQAITTGKRLIAAARLTPLDVQLEDEAESVANALGSADAREGIQAFLEKRKPQFS